MSEPKWVTRAALLRLHQQSLAQFGGLDGLRDEGLLESAIARPQHTYHYKPECDLCDLAADYAFGIAKNHPFADDNKRAVLLALGVFLAINGRKLTASQTAAYEAIIHLAAGEWDETELSGWIRANSA